MKFAILIALSVTLVYGWNGDAVQFSADEPRRVQLKHFHYGNCGDPSTDLLVLKNLFLGPDPLKFPGKLNGSFSAEIKQTASSGIGASLVIKQKDGLDYIKVPCVANFGSCTYDDLCGILANIPACPDAFVQNNIPCQCPFGKGKYNLPPTEFDLGYVPIPSGDYWAVAHITWNNKAVACVNITATIA